MQRRDVLKAIPLSIAGLSEFAAAGAENRKQTVDANREPLVAQVRLHHGTPTLFLNNQPAFAGMCWEPMAPALPPAPRCTITFPTASAPPSGRGTAP